MKHSTTLLLVALLILVAACGEEAPPVAVAPDAPPSPPAFDATATTGQAEEEEEKPRPPVYEDFQGQPQLSLFPRVGDFQPEDDSDKLPYWNTFIEHLSKMAGVANDPTGDRAWSFRSINSIDSVGYFSPFAVEPQATYRVAFRITTELPPKASAGIGILEFDQFLWISDQFTESLFKEHHRGTSDGHRATGHNDRREASFTFTTGPDTRMIHLVLYRDGEHDRNPVVFDEIRIERED